MTAVSEAAFDVTESRFRFIMNPDSDSLANRVVSGFVGVASVTSMLLVFVGDVGVTSFYC